MKNMSKFIKNYENYIIKKEKLYSSMRKINLLTLVGVIVLITMSYFIGLLFNSLNNIGYLIVMNNIVVLCSYFIYKLLKIKQYNEKCDEKYPMGLMIPMNMLYVFIIMMIASLFLLLGVFFGYVSILLTVIFALLAIISIVIYINIYKEASKIVIPSIFMVILNGLFIGILFYALLMLFHINSIFITFFVVGPSLYIFVMIKQYLEKRFIFTFKRTPVILVGIVVVSLSFPFTRAFNYASFYRGEFTFDILYDKLDGAIHEFEDGVKGDVIFYKDYIVIVDEEIIRFFNQDFEELFTLDNDYSAVYLMNDKLYANKVFDITSNYIELQVFDTNSFFSVGEFYAFNPEDRVYFEDNAYFSINGFVYLKEEGSNSYHFIENEEIIDFTIAEQQKDFIVFRHLYPFLGTPYSYRDDVQGVTYDNIAYNNGRIAYNYTAAYVTYNEDRIDPEDGGRFVYLSTTEDYFSDRTEAAPSIVLPRLFRLNEFYYIDGYYYLVGYFEFTTHDYNYKVLVVNEEGEIVKDLIFEGPSFAVSKDYMIYGDENLKVFPIDSKVINTFWIVNGYGLMFFAMSLASLFAIERVHLNAKERKEEKKNIFE